MISRLLLVLLASFLLANFAQAYEQIDYKDGKVHDVKKIPEYSCNYRLDYLSKGDPTTLNFTSKVVNSAGIKAYQESKVNLLNADCFSLYAHDNAVVSMLDSEVNNMTANESCVVTLTNSVVNFISIEDNAKVTIVDGRIDMLSTQSINPVTISSGRYKSFSLSEKGQIIIIGSDFRLDGVPTNLTKITNDTGGRHVEHVLSFTLENKYYTSVKILIFEKTSIILEQIKGKTEVKPK
jgi:hypothetical protein